MIKNMNFYLILCGMLLLLPTFTFAKKNIPTPAPWLDDANLHAVQFVGTKTGWAVGDRGVIWKTTDSGDSWKLISSPVKCSLKSICFLSDQVGWIAGGSTEEFTRISKGVILFTKDGGETWLQPAKFILPTIYKVKFFSLKNGIAVGGTSVKEHTSVYTTSDGGETWDLLPGQQMSKWRAADFLSNKNGVVAGLDGQFAIVGNAKVLKTNIPSLGNRALKGIKLNQDFSGWLVGEGGLLLKTKNAGIAWLSPYSKSFPNEIRKMFDFETVTTYKKNVWVAGQPGSIIWHSNDDGQNWRPQKTMQNLPIRSLHFANDRQGWAVGAMGMILKTTDGGRTWKNTRGHNRRVAYMGIYSDAKNISCPLITQLSGEEGYRSVLLLPMQNRANQTSQKNHDLDQRWHDAVIRAGGNVGLIGSQFDVALPEIEQEKKKLIAELQRRSEGQFGLKFVEHLVRQIRTWRPSIILLHHQESNNKLDELLVEAVTKAVTDAADSTRFLLHQEGAALSAWKVQQVFVRGKDSHRSNISIDASKYLPHVAAINNTISSPAYGMITSQRQRSTLKETYAAITIHGQKPNNTVRHFFAEIPLQSGSTARRKLLKIDADNLERQLKLARRQRNIKGIAEHYLDHPQHSEQMISQLNNITKGMTDEQAALQLASLGHDYIKKNRWELAEATFVNLAERYPRQPVTRDAMRWLFQLWGSAEPVWQRLRAVTTEKQQLETNVAAFRQRIQRALDHVKVSPLQRLSYNVNATLDPVAIIKQAGGMNPGNDGDWRSRKNVYWQEQALQLASFIRKTSPQLFESPDIQFSIAALMRQRGSARLADRYMHRFQSSGKEGRWKKTADAEMWLVTAYGEPPQKSLICKRTTTRPKLDGLLSESCWENAAAVKLNNGKEVDAQNIENTKKQAFTMWAYDREYLYLAASFPKHAELKYDPIKQGGRTHDADLRGHDRINLKIDIDRDYTTYYGMHIDQRGWTADECFGNKKWNPKWHVATKEDEKNWRIEVAIPFTELSPTPPRRGSIWAINITRVLPAIGFESWTKRTTEGVDTFGYLRFR